MINIKFNLCLILWICLPFACSAYLDRDLHQLNMQNGLADNVISSIYKDKDGFIWFGTSNGLSRYDGKKVINYRFKDVGSNISDIDESFDGILTFVSNGTLCAFDLRREEFIPVVTPSGEDVRAHKILAKDNSSLWVIYGRELRILKKVNYADKLIVSSFATYSNWVDHKTNLSVFTYSQDKKNLCLIDNKCRIIILDSNTMKPVRIVSMGFKNSIQINSVLYDNNRIWISTIEHGLIHYNVSTGKVTRLTYSIDPSKSSMTHTDVFKVVRINANRYLAVTWNGYTLIDINLNKPDEISTELFSNTSSLMYRNIETRMISACYDSSGILWIGTDGGGVIWSDLRMQFYKRFYQNRHNEICTVLSDNDNYLWMATFHKGIMRSDSPFSFSDNLTFTSYGTEQVKNKATVLCGIKDRYGNLWFGNNDGTLTYYDSKRHKFDILKISNNSEDIGDAVWALLEDKKGDIWIGTSRGLWILEHKTREYRRVIFNNDRNFSLFSIRAIVQTNDGTIWIGTSTLGLCRVIGRDTLKFGYESKYGVSGRSVRSLLASSQGVLYIGYRTGLGILYPDKDVIEKIFTTNDGLCSNFIGCITEDDKGQIWLGSNSAVSRYSSHSHLFYNYYVSGSNRSAFCHGNVIFWGNNKNLTYFIPDDIKSHIPREEVVITGLDVNNKAVETGKELHGQVVLPQSIYYTSDIKLNYENRNFSLTFNNLSFSENQQKYIYRLLPYQNHWIISNGNEKVSYANLPAGKYVFEVKNIYPDDKESSITRLNVTILPHWSETFLFRLFLFCIVLLMVYGLIHRIRLKQKRLRHELQLEQEVFAAKVERDKEKQIRVERENFFTNAAHELRTPLTLILSPLQELLSSSKSQDNVYDKLSTMYRNGNAMQRLVDDLLYIQKIEAGMINLNLSNVDIVSLARDVTDSFNNIAISGNFDYKVELLKEPLKMWIDTEKIASAIRNILSNAFKYTSKSGNVSFKMERVCIDDYHFCSITVSDSGKGIPLNMQKSIFKSFITGENTPLFSNKVGIGLRIVKNTMDIHHGSVLLESTPDKGSKFTLYIPEGKEHFRDDRYKEVETQISIENEIIDIPSVKDCSEEVKPNTKRAILIVEDNTEIREYVVSLFNREYNVFQAANGEEGVEMAISKLPDIIISDIMMPMKDGFECCKEIRENPSTAHIPILMLTAKAEDVDLLMASNIGADDYMMKPFNPDILISRVSNLIAQRERLKRIYTKTLMLQHSDSDENRDKDNFMNQLINIIESHISDKEFNVKMLSEQMCMSQPTLYRKIKQYSELSAIDIIRSVRMSKAASLILEKRYSIAEIVEMVGYTDTRTLRKHFADQFGVSPSKFIDF